MAQHFKYTAALDKIGASGFYTIPISPQLSAYTRVDFADIRIADDKKQWVPHILRSANTVRVENMFTAFTILQNTVTDSGKNLLIVENKKAESIYDLRLSLKNAAVNRTAIVSGSNDQRNWFIIDDHVPISRSYENTKDEYLQQIKFPPATYRYLKIIIDNMHNDPLLITRIGYFSKSGVSKPLVLQDDPMPAFTQKDSNNSSYIEVRQDVPYQFDRISLTVSGPKYYSRDVEIYLPGYSKNKTAPARSIVGNFKLMSALPAVVELPRTKATRFFILIVNADNPPLKIEKVGLQQQSISLVAFLEQGKRYDLMFGDSLASFPDYDLQLFNDSITMPLPLSHGNINLIKRNVGGSSVPDNSKWIWVSIIFAGTILSFLTFRLIGDINKSKTS